MTALTASAVTKVNTTKTLVTGAIPKTNWTAKAATWNASLAAKAASWNATLASKASAIPTVNKTAWTSFAAKNLTAELAALNATKATLKSAASASAPKPKNLTAILAPYAATWNATKPAKKNMTLTYVDPTPTVTAAWNKTVAKLNASSAQSTVTKATLNATLARKAAVLNATLANKAAAAPAWNKTAAVAALPAWNKTALWG